MAIEIVRERPENLQALRDQAIESTERCEELAQEVNARKQLIEDTRNIIADLRGKIKLIHR